jgi:type I restriction enzyme S subunit
MALDSVAEFVSDRISVDQVSAYVSTENLLPDFEGVNLSTKLPSVNSLTYFQPKDVLISNIRPYLKKVWQSDTHGGASNDVLVVRARTVDADYLAAILRSDLFIDYVMRSAKGVKMPRGEISAIRDFPVACPSPAEQRRIADCFFSLDACIGTEIRKLDALRAHKQGLMQQLFPAEGQRLPRLRFPGFNGVWEEKRLGQICTVLQGYGFPEVMQGKPTGKFPFCKVSDVSKAVIDNCGALASAVNYVDDEDLRKLKAKPVPAGTTVFARIGEGLRLNRRAFVGRDCLIDNNVGGLKPIAGVASDYFVYQLSQLIDLNEHCGGAVPSVNKSTLEAIAVVVPKTLGEQQRIADAFAPVDAVIAAQTRKIAELQQHRKGLMQGLFRAAEFQHS